MKELCKEIYDTSQRSEISDNTGQKVFKSYSKLSQEGQGNNLFKLSTDPKNDSTAQSTQKSENDKLDSLTLYLKEGKNERKKILNKRMDSKLELQKVVVEIEEEIESYSMKSDKVEEFPLSFRPTGLVIKDSNNDSNNKNEEKMFSEIKKYQFLEDKKEDKSLNCFADDFYIDPELEANNEKAVIKGKSSKDDKNNDCDSIKDLVVVDETPIEISKKPSPLKINAKEILKNLAENSYWIENEKYHINSLKEENIEDKMATRKFEEKGKINCKMNVEIPCCLSRIDKGNAIFVTNKNQIFKLPRIFLPKNYIKGNSFKITFEETEKSNQKFEKIRFLQNKHLFK